MQGKAASPLQTKKSDPEIVWENEKKFQFCPSEKEMGKMLDDLHPFTYNSVRIMLETLVKTFNIPPTIW